MCASPRKRLSLALSAESGNLPNRLFNASLAFLILLNITASIIASTAIISDATELVIHWLRGISFLIFSIEYLLRFYAGYESQTLHSTSPIIDRVKFIFTPLMITDLFAIAPFFLGINADLIILRVFRLLHILRITHHSPALGVLVNVINREKKTLFALFFVMGILLILISWGMYLMERKAQPETFSSIPSAMWWTMATLSTVGYGDTVPVTLPGKIFGGIVMLIGIGMFAVPTGILVSGFAREIKRKDFIATWNLVAQVPSFDNLNATEIANISDLLRLRTMMPNEVIFRKDDEADSMYFIVEGVVEADLGNKPVTLSQGDFFGEVSLMYKRKRTGTVTAMTLTELLRLDAKDLDSFLESNHTLRDKIASEASKRLASDAESAN